MGGRQIIGSRIEERLGVIGISQAELGRRVNLHQSTINELIRKGGNSRFLHKIARELSTTPAYLTGETNDPAADLPEDTLTAEEREWVEQLRRVPKKDRTAALQLLRSISGGAK